MYLVKGFYHKDKEKYEQTVIVQAKSETEAINLLLSTTIGLFLYEVNVQKIESNVFILNQTISEKTEQIETIQVQMKSINAKGTGTRIPAIQCLMDTLNIDLNKAKILVIQEVPFIVTSKQFVAIKNMLAKDNSQFYTIRQVSPIIN